MREYYIDIASASHEELIKIIGILVTYKEPIFEGSKYGMLNNNNDRPWRYMRYTHSEHWERSDSRGDIFISARGFINKFKIKSNKLD